MARQPTVVIVLCGPNHGKLNTARINKAIKLANRFVCPLVICGDANDGRDVLFFGEKARIWGVSTIVLGFHEGNQFIESARQRGFPIVVQDFGRNTRGDAVSAAKAMELLDSPDAALLVTHWYHVIRAYGEVRDAVVRMRQGIAVKKKPLSLFTASVFADFLEGFRLLPHEMIGAFDRLRGKPHQSRGRHHGKPDLERHA